MYKKLPSFLKNKYFYTILGFLVWMLLFDKNNFIYQAELSSDLNDFKNEKEYYINEIKINNSAIKELLTNATTLEKFAREKYLMKRDNEDIYIIVEEEEN
ncbi:MAG: septum formation inhibitor [Bacteroidales bacterium]|nr:septum formation inhibitor [Bacteroidales bacterium]